MVEGESRRIENAVFLKEGRLSDARKNFFSFYFSLITKG